MISQGLIIPGGSAISEKNSVEEIRRSTSRFGPSAINVILPICILPNVQDEPRPWLARLVLLGARDVTAMVVGSGALLGFLVSSRDFIETNAKSSEPWLPRGKRARRSG